MIKFNKMSDSIKQFFYELASLHCETEEQKAWLVDTIRYIANELVVCPDEYHGDSVLIFAMASQLYKEIGYKKFDVEKYLNFWRTLSEIEAYKEDAKNLVYLFIKDSIIKGFKDDEKYPILGRIDFKKFVSDLKFDESTNQFK